MSAVPREASEDFWRRSGKQGKEASYEINKLYEESIITENKQSESINIIDAEVCISALFEGSNRNK